MIIVVTFQSEYMSRSFLFFLSCRPSWDCHLRNHRIGGSSVPSKDAKFSFSLDIDPNRDGIRT